MESTSVHTSQKVTPQHGARKVVYSTTRAWHKTTLVWANVERSITLRMRSINKLLSWHPWTQHTPNGARTLFLHSNSSNMCCEYERRIDSHRTIPVILYALDIV